MKKLVAILLCALLLTSMIVPVAASAEDEAVLTFATYWSGGPNAVEATDSVYM